jgi:uncharacterized membrane protein
MMSPGPAPNKLLRAGGAAAARMLRRATMSTRHRRHPSPAMRDPPDLAHPVVVHFYRAVVGHMDVWRQRMDATTNWAAATTAAMVTFSFGSAQSPHFVLLLALAFNGVFLVMESRRYQTFDLWRRRFRVLNLHVVAPVLGGAREVDAEAREAIAGLGADLGRMLPRIGLGSAVGFRLRRNYGYLLAVGLVAWLLKLEVHPAPAGGPAEWVARAAVGTVPGAAVFAGVAALVLLGLVLAVRAPSEGMLNWEDLPSPFERWRRRRPAPGPAGEAP